MNVPRELIEAMLSTDTHKPFGLRRIADELESYGQIGMAGVLRGYVNQLETLSQEDNDEKSYEDAS